MEVVKFVKEDRKSVECQLAAVRYMQHLGRQMIDYFKSIGEIREAAILADQVGTLNHTIRSLEMKLWLMDDNKFGAN